ncbi:hypothetical protein J4455_04810 [Candidatus Woesearchaeota archaeon]|nr:hypothetical protein [Candidatus Woesearchaeota archaeon]
MIDRERFHNYLNELLTDFTWSHADACYYVRKDSPQAKSIVSLSAGDYKRLVCVKEVSDQLDESSQDLYFLLVGYHEARTDVRPEFEKAVLRIRNIIRTKARSEIGDIILRAWRAREIRKN